MNPPGPYLSSGTPPPPMYGGYRPRRGLLFLGVAIAAIVLVGVVVWLLLPRPTGRLGFWYPFGGFFVVFLVLWLAFMAVRMEFWGSRRQRYWAARQNLAYGRPGGFDPAIRTARMRFARGEITHEQYDQIVRGLRPPPPPT